MIKLQPVKINNTIKQLDTPEIYTARSFGLSTEYTGKKVSIGIIGTGIPIHPDVGDFADVAALDDTIDSPDDHDGYSTMLTGILTSKNKHGVIGICPDANIFHIKMFESSSDVVTLDTLIASVLWCLIKNIDVLVMPVLVKKMVPQLEETLEKAYNDNLCMLAYGSRNNLLRHCQYVMPVINSTRKSCRAISVSIRESGISFKDPKGSRYTTYANGLFVKAPISIIAVGVLSGLCANLIEMISLKKKTYHPNDIFSALSTMTKK